MNCRKSKLVTAPLHWGPKSFARPTLQLQLIRWQVDCQQRNEVTNEARDAQQVRSRALFENV